MTYCLGIKVKDGLVGIADTRISAGTSTTVKKKVLILQHDNASLFIMTSGLRSVRDKAVHYFQELVSNGIVYDKLYKAVNAFGEQIKRVAEEHKLFLLYTEGNWVELDEGSPFTIIGNSGQGKAILNRVINEDTTIRQAL